MPCPVLCTVVILGLRDSIAMKRDSQKFDTEAEEPLSSPSSIFKQYYVSPIASFITKSNKSSRSFSITIVLLCKTSSFPLLHHSGLHFSLDFSHQQSAAAATTKCRQTLYDKFSHPHFVSQKYKKINFSFFQQCHVAILPSLAGPVSHSF